MNGLVKPPEKFWLCWADDEWTFCMEVAEVLYAYERCGGELKVWEVAGSAVPVRVVRPKPYLEVVKE